MLPDLGLLPAALVFLGSASLVVFSSVYLAKYGDLLADLTGWGRLWVGTLLVALATSLPEVTTAITAARLPDPDLITGTVFGANMKNIVTLAAVALPFGASRFMAKVAREQGYLVGVAVALTGLAVIMGAIGPDLSIGRTGLGALLILLLYLGGMRLVYMRRPAEPAASKGNDPQGVITLRQAWRGFAVASVGVIAAAIALAYSANQVAEETGVATGFMGLVAVAAVTTMPEATVVIAAVRLGAVDMAVGTLYGSCTFNILLLAIADPFYRQGAILGTVEAPQIAGGLFALLLMCLGSAQFLLRKGSERLLPPRLTCAAMLAIYLGGIYIVFILG